MLPPRAAALTALALLGACARLSPRPSTTDPALERLAVPGDGAPVTFASTLADGAIYLLRATGAVERGGGKRQDAEFEFDGGGQADEVDGIDVGVDVGLLALHQMNHTTVVPPGPGRMKWFGGGYRGDHVYYLVVTGAGKPLTLSLRARGATASPPGAIDVTLYQLGPPPPALYQYHPSPAPPPPPPPRIGGEALETVQVPLLRTVVQGHFVTENGAIYLLQASGAAQVSRGQVVSPDHLHAGDAQYMDWRANGTRFNDGECGAEFGIGVDELEGPAPCTGGIIYAHRRNWWGPYRNDHVYYMLYAGTGRPLSFLYYDSGYRDNSTVDTLTVRLFRAP